MKSPLRLHPDKADKIILTTCLLQKNLRKDRSIIQHDITYSTIDLHSFLYIKLYYILHFILPSHSTLVIYIFTKLTSNIS